MLEGLCKSLRISSLRIDGATQHQKRMNIVDEFNKENSSSAVLLLSAKAGFFFFLRVLSISG